MTKASDNVFPRFLISEGGSTATPAAGNVTVYAKADGLLYSKDDAGTETLVSGGAGGAGGGIDSGTSNPGSPTDGDLFYRTDLDLMIRYRSTGTRWVSATLYRSPIPTILNTITASSTGGRLTGPVGSGFGWWVERFEWTAYVTTTNSGTQYWNCQLERFDGGTSANVGSVLTTQSLAADQYLGLSTTPGVELASTIEEVQFSITKVSTAGTLIVASPVIAYRLIVT